MTWSGYCLLLWLLCWIGLPQHACSGSRDAELATKVKQWEQLAKDSFDSTRKTHLTNILSNQAGIYVDSSHALREGRLDVEIVQKSVIVLTIESIPKALLDHLISSSKATPSAATSTLLQQKHHQAPEAQDKEERLERYMQFLFNLLCYFKHHQLKALLFVNFHLPSTSANSSNSANNSQRTESQHSSTLNDAMIEAQIVLCDSFRVYLQSVYQHVDVVSYPDYLFWSYVARKTRPIESGRGKADYEGFDIRYQRFGALPMLIPSMEVISLGFHVIYFDVDMVFLDDPIPHLLHNARRVDIVVSPELRTCEYPSFSYDIHWSLHMEANTGIMFVKSSTHSLKYIDTWLMRNVEENVHNDQRVMGLHVYEGSTWVKDCDRHYDDQMEVRRHEPSPSPTLCYCFTSEFQFFNGYMEFFCHQHKHTPRSLQERDIQRSVFDYTMYFYGNKKGFPSEGEPRVGNLSITAQLAMMNSSIRSFQQQQKQHVTSKKKDTIFFYPVVLHVNYCDHKRKELESRGLWLLQQDRHNHTKYQCQAFNLYQTEYAKVDFATKLTLARDELEDMLKKSMWSHDNLLEVSQQLKSNVSLLTWPTQASWMVYFYKFLPNYYYYDAGYLRPITDMSNLLLLGKDAKITVQRLSRKAHQIIPYGQSIALEPHIEHLTCAAQHHRHQYQALPMYLQQHLKHHADVVQKLALKDQKLLPLMDAKQGTSQSSSTNTSTNEHMIPLPLLKLQQDAMKLSQAFKLDNRWENLKSLLQEVTKKQVDRFHNQSMYSKIENKPAIKQAYLDFYSKTVFVHILRIQKSTALYQELLQNYICMAKEHDLVLVIYLLELDPQRFEEHAKAIMALSEHIHVIDYPYALYWQMVGKKSMQSLGPVQFRFIDVHFKNVGFVLMVIPMYEILQLGYNVLYLDLDIGLLRNPVPYLVHSDADLILSAELRTCHFDSILHDAKATTTLKLSELNTGILFAKSNPNTLKLYETWILAIVNQGIVNDQKALRIGDFGGMQVFDCNPLLPRDVVQQHYSKPVTDNKISNPTVKFCVLNDLLFQVSILFLS